MSGNYSRFNNDRSRRNFGPREMHKAVCSECQKECEVPFKPTEGKPVYCRDCFRNKRPM
ncbi:MAG: CxxC-x17-CxxC domain-containing protein [Nanoarchaeota archaeon]